MRAKLLAQLVNLYIRQRRGRLVAAEVLQLGGFFQLFEGGHGGGWAVVPHIGAQTR